MNATSWEAAGATGYVMTGGKKAKPFFPTSAVFHVVESSKTLTNSMVASLYSTRCIRKCTTAMVSGPEWQCNPLEVAMSPQRRKKLGKQSPRPALRQRKVDIATPKMDSSGRRPYIDRLQCSKDQICRSKPNEPLIWLSSAGIYDIYCQDTSFATALRNLLSVSDIHSRMSISHTYLLWTLSQALKRE